MISALGLKGIALIHKMLTLILVKTFFIDWERPRLNNYFNKNENNNFEIIKKEEDEIKGNNNNNNNNNSVVIW
jgi:hypothetical protein